MEPKKIIASPVLPLVLASLILLWPSFCSIVAIISLAANPITVGISEPSARREFQRFFRKYGIEINFNDISMAGSGQFFKIKIPMAIQVPFTGYLEYKVAMRIRNNNR